MWGVYRSLGVLVLIPSAQSLVPVLAAWLSSPASLNKHRDGPNRPSTAIHQHKGTRHTGACPEERKTTAPLSRVVAPSVRGYSYRRRSRTIRAAVLDPGVRRHLHYPGRTDDAGPAVAGAVVVGQLVLLQADRPRAPAHELVSCGAPHVVETGDDHVVLRSPSATHLQTVTDIRRRPQCRPVLAA